MKAPPKRRAATVAEIAPLGPGLGRVDLVGEGIGQDVVAGRFAMVQAVGRADCILLRPFSYFSKVHADRVGLLVKDVGKGTRSLLTARVGDDVAILGPLGTAFPTPASTCWAVAGGVGAAPFGVMQHSRQTRVLFGARSVAESGFARALTERGAHVVLATDDGSSGFTGSVVDLLRAQLEEQAAPGVIYTCGPSPMMAAVAAVAREHGIACFASLEAHMGCGIGVCRGCAHRDAQKTWRCICVDGRFTMPRRFTPHDRYADSNWGPNVADTHRFGLRNVRLGQRARRHGGLAPRGSHLYQGPVAASPQRPSAATYLGDGVGHAQCHRARERRF